MAKMRLLEPRGGPHSSGHNVSKACLSGGRAQELWFRA
ncbi:MAG: hypothetical protein IRF6MM_02235 [Candidatus Midichloria mitochondrii]